MVKVDYSEYWPSNYKPGRKKWDAEMSHKEVADELGISEQAVLATERRALRKLRAMLGIEGGDRK